jgi:DNA polymerase-3 subunit alpha (Gram-positive type)
MSSMLFFDVFPQLNLPQKLRESMADVTVTKISQTTTHTSVLIFTMSSRILNKRTLFEVEKLLKKQYFPKDGRVRIMDRYHLSEQYTPKYILEEYKDSIDFELRQYWPLLFSLYTSSDVELSENVLTISVPGGMIADSYKGSLEQYFEQIFRVRFGRPVQVEMREKSDNQEAFQREKTARMDRRVREIQSRAAQAAGKEKVSSARASRPSSAASSSGAKPAASQAKSGGTHTFSGYRQGGENGARKFFRKPENPDVLYGRDFDDEPIPISSIETEMGRVTIDGMIRKVEEMAIRGERTILIFDVTDFTDTISCKMFLRNEELPDVKTYIKEGSFILLRGITQVDTYAGGDVTITRVEGIRKSSDHRKVREDLAADKRVELHCHTKMSDMDGVSYAKDIIRQAIKWGHKAVAITDHGVVQAFTDAYHTMQGLYKDYDKTRESLDFKVIYGCEVYLVDDTRKLVVNSKGQKLKDTFVVFDIETTGFSAEHNEIIEIGAVKVTNGVVADRFSEFVHPTEGVPPRITELTSITNEMVSDAKPIEDVLPRFLKFIGDAAVVAHNAEFDTSFITAKAAAMGIETDFTIVDTMTLTQFLVPTLNNYRLETLVKYFNVNTGFHHHRAVDDAEATAGIYIELIKMLAERDIFDLDTLNERGCMSDDTIKKLHQHHAIILAATEQGRINLYRLITASHMQYFYRYPKVPKSLVLKYREGLIIGSACVAGELYQALLRGVTPTEIARIVNFYDYLEIQPLANNAFLINDEESFIKSEDDLREMNRRIVKLGERFHKPVVATSDAHFLNPEDEIYRSIILAGKGMGSEAPAPLYLHTTDEMLHEFDYLGPKKAFEVVVRNPDRIRRMCEPIIPVRPDKRPPVIANSDQTLRRICTNRAHEIYGPVLPDIVEKRLDKELNSIISNGYSVMYIIAQQLVWKANDDGYMVGSRGSVGSSFAAYTAGITEVNSLAPHYLCPVCHYVDFDDPECKKHAGGAGIDMPDKYCPKCGHKLKKMGFDIPFETFLGFKGNKEPDIDLNFSNEYQSKAHAYTEVIFGKGQTFKAGTIGTVADKTAYGFVMHYFEDMGEREHRVIKKRRCEMERLAAGCVDVRRTTGQHPGGIVVLPIGEDINTFTPVQHPANDMKTPITTTHFDYHSIDHNLLKLDILGHLDPTMIRMLQDLTGLDPMEIPMDSKEVMELFKSTKSLGITPDQIGGCELGALGIPEFGTDNAMQMLKETKPKQFADLVRISGLSHGTDVWHGNAQDLIREGKATISTAICTRDDIMTYLISKGMDHEKSFTIMEKVRKGKGLKPEWIEEMKAHGVPDWYIGSCQKIKYMFPKAHAAAYVMMAWRVAYCKVFYPLAYYTAYFSIRANAFDYEMMAQGPEVLAGYLSEYREKKKAGTLTGPEEEALKDMRIVEEMYARGFRFTPIDIYKAKARRFQIIDGKIMPSFKVVSKIGEVAGESIEIAAEKGKFLSKEDLRNRAKVGQTVIDKLDSLHLLEGMSESNQLSIFDMMGGL